jgi:hypothetical protein
MRSVHDNSVYAYTVFCEERRIVLHTHFRDGGANELTDVVFEGVEAHFFRSGHDSNILFDIVQVEPEKIVREYGEVFVAGKNYGWPRIEYKDDADLVAILNRRGVKGFEIYASFGLEGWVLASQMSQVERQTALGLV